MVFSGRRGEGRSLIGLGGNLIGMSYNKLEGFSWRKITGETIVKQAMRRNLGGFVGIVR